MSRRNPLTGSTELRARFASRLSDLYGREVPAYRTLLEVCREVNDRVMARDGLGAQQLGSIDRVTQERHGAIRVGTPQEMQQVTRIFTAFGMSELRPIFLDLTAASFVLSPDPVDGSWYDELQQISGVAADIAGVDSTHINHLTPRVLDIDDLYESMQTRGVEMIDQIQGPPRWAGPDVLLRQTSFRELAEPRAFNDDNGVVTAGTLRVRFGEVEARGVALTGAGRHRYEELGARIDRQCAADAGSVYQDVARQVWTDRFPGSMAQSARTDLAFFGYEVAAREVDGRRPPRSLSALLDGDWLTARPIVYEDFLPRSAAGIFASNLDDGGDDGEPEVREGGAPRDRQWLAGAIDASILDPDSAYAREQVESLGRAARVLGLDPARCPVGEQ